MSSSGLKENTVEKISLIDIPVVVDFKDLGDVDKGYLIGEEGRKILNRVMKDLPVGRYSKDDISKRISGLKDPSYSKKDIKKKLPYIPGIIKDYGYDIRILSGRPTDDRVNENELCFYIDKSRLYYAVKDETGAVHRKWLVMGSDLEQSEYMKLYGIIQEANKDAAALLESYKKKVAQLRGDPDSDPNEIEQIRREMHKLNGVLIQSSFAENPDTRNLQHKLFNIALAKKHIPEPALTAVYKGKTRSFGAGAFGKVKAGFNINKPKWDVVKVQQPGEDASIGDYVAEAKALRTTGLGHGMVIKRRKHSFFHKPVDQYNVVMDYSKGLTLKEYLIFNKDISLALLLDISLKITEKLKEIHGNHYLHCDLKLDNILYNPVTGEVSIIDLGLVLATSPTDKKPTAYSTFRGALDYAAPELDRREGVVSEYTEQTEVYAVGVCLKKMFGLEPMSMKTLDGVFAPFVAPCKIKQTSLETFINQMADDDPDKRPALSAVSSKLKGFRNEMLPVYPRVLGMLNISDYAKCSETEKMELIYALRSVDVVVLIDDGNSKLSKLEVSKIRKELMEYKLFVEKDLYKSNDPAALVDEIKKDYQYKTGAGIRAVDHLCYMHSKHRSPMQVEGVDSVIVRKDATSGFRKIRSRTGIVSETHLNVVIAELDGHIGRFKTKSASKLKTLQDMRDKINSYKDKNITYIQLFNDLEQLERSIVKERWANMFRSTQERLTGIQGAEAKIQRDIELKQARESRQKLGDTAPRLRRS